MIYKVVFCFSKHHVFKSTFRDFEEDDPDWVSELKMMLKQND